MATAVQTIQTLMGTLKNYSTSEEYIGVEALDQAIRTSTIFASTENAINGLTKALGNTENYPESDTRLKEATGMVILPTLAQLQATTLAVQPLKMLNGLCPKVIIPSTCQRCHFPSLVQRRR